MKNSYYLIGDFNPKHQLWNNIRANATGKILYDEMTRNNFIIHHPPTPTYHPPQARAVHPSTIDIAITNNMNIVSQMEALPVLSSDHNAVEFTIFTHSIVAPKTTRRYDLTNWNEFKQPISRNLSSNVEINTEATINTVISFFNETLNSAIDLYVPIKQSRSHALVLSTSTILKIIHWEEFGKVRETLISTATSTYSTAKYRQNAFPNETSTSQLDYKNWMWQAKSSGKLQKLSKAVTTLCHLFVIRQQTPRCTAIKRKQLASVMNSQTLTLPPTIGHTHKLET